MVTTDRKAIANQLEKNELFPFCLRVYRFLVWLPVYQYCLFWGLCVNTFICLLP